MKEILLDFEEFKQRYESEKQQPGGKYIHYGFRTTYSVPFEHNLFSITFRSGNNIVCYQKSASFMVGEDEKAKQFASQCKALAEQVGATPGEFMNSGKED